MATGDLVTLQQALQYLNQPADTNGTIAFLISAVSTKIQKFVSYQFAQGTYTRTFNGQGGRSIPLPDRPVISVSSLSIGLHKILPATPATGNAPGFVSDDKFVYLTDDCFERGFQNVTVSYTAGYATVPMDVQEACLEWMVTAWNIAIGALDPSARSVRAGDTQIDYRAMTTELRSAIVLMPPSVAGTLLPYQRTSP